jgi:hypothetical protein
MMPAYGSGGSFALITVSCRVRDGDAQSWRDSVPGDWSILLTMQNYTQKYGTRSRRWLERENEVRRRWQHVEAEPGQPNS